jgi:hypothetical protein
MTVDVSELRDSIIRWASDGAGQALEALREVTHDRAPYGVYDEEQSGPHILETEEALILSEGETWTGTLAYTAPQAGYQDRGAGPIFGNPWLYFRWQGHLIRVHETAGYSTHVGWFSEATTEADWVDAVTQALDAAGNPV